MISMLYLMNTKGDIVISRQYRDDVSASTADTFRQKVRERLGPEPMGKSRSIQTDTRLPPLIPQIVAAKEASTSAPIRNLDSSTFIFTRHLNIYFVAVTRSNVNPR